MEPIPDPLLLPLLQSPSPREADRRLQALLQQHVAPVVAGIVRQRTGVSPVSRARLFQSRRAEDAEDIYVDALASIGARLRADAESLRAITSLQGYAAVATYRSFYAHLRRTYPVRSKLKEEVRAALQRDPGLALWRILTAWAGGLAHWPREEPAGGWPTSSPRLLRLCDDPDALSRELPGQPNVRLLRMPELLHGLFGWLEHPVKLDSLVGVVADQWGLRDLGPEESLDQPAGSTNEAGREVADRATDTPTIAARNALFRRLWEQIRELPPRQCAALLLNWKDEGGRLTAVFTDSGAATRAEMARAMDLPLKVLNALWDDLPIDDNEIAELLGATRQQVINLRASALKRLRNRERVIVGD